MLVKKKLLQMCTWLFKAGFASHAFLKYALQVGLKKIYICIFSRQKSQTACKYSLGCKFNDIIIEV
jgi:hypothetical protein